MLLPLLCFGPMVLAPFVWLAGRKNDRVRDLLAAVICALALGGCLTLLSGEVRFSIDGFCGLGLHLRADGFRSLYASVAAFMWLVSDVFAPQYMHHDGMRNRYWLFNLWTLVQRFDEVIGNSLELGHGTATKVFNKEFNTITITVTIYGWK